MRLLIIVLMLSSCGSKPEFEQYEASDGSKYKVECFDGVEYYDGMYTLAPKYTREGKISLCKSNPLRNKYEDNDSGDIVNGISLRPVKS